MLASTIPGASRSTELSTGDGARTVLAACRQRGGRLAQASYASSDHKDLKPANLLVDVELVTFASWVRDRSRLQRKWQRPRSETTRAVLPTWLRNRPDA